MKGGQLDDLVQSFSLHTHTNVLFHAYSLPFLVIYVLWLYLWATFGFSEFAEGGFVGIVGIAFVQILCSLCCYWSVHINCLFTCKSVSKQRKWVKLKG